MDTRTQRVPTGRGAFIIDPEQNEDLLAWMEENPHDLKFVDDERAVRGRNQ